jgi:hypothetical protein
MIINAVSFGIDGSRCPDWRWSRPVSVLLPGFISVLLKIELYPHIIDETAAEGM